MAMADIIEYLGVNNNILEYVWAGNTVLEYALALATFILIIILLLFFKHRIIRKLKNLSKRTKTEFDDLIIKLIDGINWPFYALLALYIGLQLIQIPELIGTILFYTILIGATYYVILAFQSMIDYGVNKTIAKRKREQNKNDGSTLILLSKILKATVWIIATVFILNSLGYDITLLIAGFGIGGIAIAFALQNVLGDIFASVSIFFDKPFQTGDFIVVGEDSGVVKNIGIKSTRLETLQGEELIISNKELTETRVHNYKIMKKRRVVFTFSVTHETPTTKIKNIPRIIENIIQKIKPAKLDRVHFKEFKDSSLHFEVVYNLDSSEYMVYMDTQQNINIAIKEQFEKEGIVMAYPTQTLYVNKMP
jgi:small-conductance mechanosensitive channel